ncbi:flagellar hook-associated protein FliD [Vibrio maritimus]|uniref:Flagellar hook-associated protein 2 n=1 Tax=Vibrio maritimus TaxID=990268 RepID=A0A090TB03_9VIBR|nr:flagellar hook-associated protein FliD [Vibrio maritimus]
MSSIDPITMAQNLATFDIQPFELRYQAQASRYQAQLTALTEVESALKAFQTAINGMNSSTESIIKNSATLSQEGYLTASADNKAIAGSYELFVKQLASKHQIVAGMPNSITQDTTLPASGELQIGVGTDSFTIDFSTLETNADGKPTIESLVKAINEHPDNTGANASLVRSNGETHFVLTSSETGSENVITTSVSNLPTDEDWSWVSQAFVPANMATLSDAKDAIVSLGGENGLIITNSSNTFDNAIEGVSFTVAKTNQTGEAGTMLTVGSDQEATKESVNKFIEAYNTLIDALDTHTSIGGEDSARGVLANDPTIRSIENQVSGLIRQSFDGTSLYEIGITTNRDGKLELDSSKFEAAQRDKSNQIETLFNGENNLFDSIDSMIKPFVQSSTGLFSGRKDNVETILEGIETKQAGLERKYEMSYNRYLAQFTQMNNLINQMNSTMGMFGTPQGMI